MPSRVAALLAAWEWAGRSKASFAIATFTQTALAGVDLRYKKLDVPLPASPFRVWLLAFADAGRVWLDGEQPSLDRLHYDAGVGFRIQFSKGSMFGVDLGMNNDTGFEFGTAFGFGF